MTNEQDIREAAERVRANKRTSAADLRARDDKIGRQAVEERTPYARLAEWVGLTPEQVSRIVRDYKRRNGIKD